MNKKVIITIIAIVVFLIFVIAVSIFTNKSPEEKLVNYIENIGFTQDSDSTLYFKLISEDNMDDYNTKKDEGIDANYEALYFNTYSHKLTKDKIEYYDNTTTSFNPAYNYYDDTINFTYRINFEDANVIINGTYNGMDEEYNCELTFAYNVDMKENYKEICEKLKYDVKDYYYEANTMINNSGILKILKTEQE